VKLGVIYIRGLTWDQIKSALMYLFKMEEKWLCLTAEGESELVKEHKNILIIDIQFKFEKVRPAIRELYYKELSKLGDKVLILLRRDIFSKRDKVLQEKRIYYRPVIHIHKYILDIFLMYTIFKMCKKYDINIIMVRNDVFVGLQGLIASRLYRKIFVFIKAFPSEELAIMYQEISNKKYRFVNKFIYNILLKFSIFIMKKSELVIAKSEAYKEYLVEKGVPEYRMLVIPMGFDCSQSPRMTTSGNLREMLNLTNDKIIIYFGDMGSFRNIEFMIDVLSDLIKNQLKVKFLMLGGTNSEIERLKNYAIKKNVNKHILFQGWVSMQEVISYLSIADISISAIPPYDIYRVSSPTKTIESMGMAVPVVANEEIPDQFSVIKESEGGLCVPYDIKSFSEAINFLIQNPIAAKKLGKNGRRYVKKNRDWSKLAKKVHKAIQMDRKDSRLNDA